MGGPGHAPLELDDGSVMQSGIHKSGDPEDGADNMGGYWTRAAVINVYYTDDPSWAGRGWAEGTVRAIACDVRTYGRSGTRPLYRVPVAQRVAGLFDEDTFVPRGARQNIDGGTLSTTATAESTRPTPAELMDCDHVLVGWLENDPHQPVILPFCLPHPNSRNPPLTADGRRRRIRFNGALIEIDKDGNITIDGSEAAKDELGPLGTETPNLDNGGKVVLRTKTTGGVTMTVEIDPVAGKVVVDAPLVELSDAATDGVLKGDTFTTALYAAMDSIAALTTSPTAAKAAMDLFKGTESTWLSGKVKVG